MKKAFALFVVALGFVTITVVSCKKEEDTSSSTTTTSGTTTSGSTTSGTTTSGTTTSGSTTGTTLPTKSLTVGGTSYNVLVGNGSSGSGYYRFTYSGNTPSTYSGIITLYNAATPALGNYTISTAATANTMTATLTIGSTTYAPAIGTATLSSYSGGKYAIVFSNVTFKNVANPSDTKVVSATITN